MVTYVSTSERMNYLIIKWINGKSVGSQERERKRNKREKERERDLFIWKYLEYEKGKFEAERRVCLLFMKGLLTCRAV